MYRYSLETMEAKLINTQKGYVSPRRLTIAAYGISVCIPDGWIASIEQDELFGLEPLTTRNHRIYVARVKNDTVGENLAVLGPIDLHPIKLIPISESYLNKYFMSANYYKVVHSPLFRQAYGASVVTAKDERILFAAVSESNVPGELVTVVDKLVLSVQFLATH